jgi:hypothetical protein
MVDAVGGWLVDEVESACGDAAREVVEGVAVSEGIRVSVLTAGGVVLVVAAPLLALPPGGIGVRMAAPPSPPFPLGGDPWGVGFRGLDSPSFTLDADAEGAWLSLPSFPEVSGEIALGATCGASA